MLINFKYSNIIGNIGGINYHFIDFEVYFMCNLLEINNKMNYDPINCYQFDSNH